MINNRDVLEVSEVDEIQALNFVYVDRSGKSRAKTLQTSTLEVVYSTNIESPGTALHKCYNPLPVPTVIMPLIKQAARMLLSSWTAPACLASAETVRHMGTERRPGQSGAWRGCECACQVPDIQLCLPWHLGCTSSHFHPHLPLSLFIHPSRRILLNP